MLILVSTTSEALGSASPLVLSAVIIDGKYLRKQKYEVATFILIMTRTDDRNGTATTSVSSIDRSAKTHRTDMAVDQTSIH